MNVEISPQFELIESIKMFRNLLSLSQIAEELLTCRCTFQKIFDYLIKVIEQDPKIQKGSFLQVKYNQGCCKQSKNW